MKREEMDKLLGGYATGTLRPEERAALFGAALEDQQLFEALLEEEPLREALEDPSARARLLAALEEPAEKPVVPEPWYYRDVHPGIIVGVAAAVILVALAVTFRPIRIGRPVNVVAQTELPQPSKSFLPTVLPPLVFGGNVPRTVAKLPDAPAIPAPGAAGTPREVRDAIDKLLLAQNPANLPASLVAEPVRPVELARGAVGRGAVFSPRVPRATAVVAPALRYSILRKLPSGELAPVDSGQALDAGDQTVIRFEAAEAGYLYVFERSADGLRRIATEQMNPAVPYTVPADGTFREEGNGPRDFQVLFSREPQSEPERVMGRVTNAGRGFVGQSVDAISASQPAASTRVFITLRYPSR
jgi:hypothetical protein